MNKFFNKRELVFKEKLSGKFQDIEGQRFNRLVVLGFAGRENRSTLWFCKCDCGNVIKVDAAALKRGNTNSCGCFRLERVRESNTTHGHKIKYRPTMSYTTWAGILARCRNPNNPNFQDYGGRGITICERWLKFENFLEDMGEKPKGTSIDRINNNGNYEPGNCRWATQKEQCNNTRGNRYLTFNGKTQTAAQWAEELGVGKSTIRNRLNVLGWSAEKTLSTPVRTCLAAIFVALASLLSAQDIFVPTGYANSYGSPIVIEPGLTLQTAIKGYFINEKRYLFYKSIHEFTNDPEFKGREREILDGFGGFLASSEEILENLTQNTSKISDSSESLKMAQNAVNSLANQVGVLKDTNLQLKEQLGILEKTKPKKYGWVVPSVIGTLLGAIGGIVLGVSL